MSRIPVVLRLPVALLLLSVGVACSGGADGGAPGEAGTVAVLELDAEYPEPFSYLSGVRELSDGKLLAADPLSKVLLRVDMDAGTADTLGAVGPGPGEYQQPDEVFPLPGDSTLLVDLGKTYLTVIAPDGTHQGGMSMVLPGEGGRMTILFPSAVDEAGRIYFGSSGVNLDGAADSTEIYRHDRATGATTTVATLWRTPPITSRAGGNVSVRFPMMLPNDDWAVGEDGRVAVVRANGYRVEWHLPDGQVVSGPETPFESLPIGQADKEAELASPRSGGLSISMSVGSAGARSMSMSRGGSFGSGDEPQVDDFEWRETFPPFRNGRAMVSDRNEVWVQRWLPVDHTPTMEVFDSLGVRIGWVHTPPRATLIGFGISPEGAEVAYFTQPDDFDLVWLKRYRVVRQ